MNSLYLPRTCTLSGRGRSYRSSSDRRTSDMLPPLHKRLTGLLKNHVYLTALAEMPVQEQTERITELNITEQLTETENKVASLLIQGKTYKAIADELCVSENTIRSHVKSIYSKAGVTSKAELINLILKPPNSPS